jgi:hypothetical protein
MALSEDSRTLLQLLLGRGKSYGDIADLLGIEEPEVRERAHQALTEIHGSDPDAEVPLTDYLLGQSDPIGRADVARQLAENESAADTAAELSDQLRLLVPGADLPRAGGAPGPGPRKSTSAPAKPKRARRVTPESGAEGEPAKRSLSGPLNSGQRRLIAILIFVALLIVVAVLLIADPFGNDDKPDPPAPSANNAGAVLQPVGNQKGSGKVQLGRVDDDFAANLQFSGLKPSGKNDSYLFWMDGSMGAFPLSEVPVDKSGEFSSTIVLPAEALCSISAGLFTDFTLSRVNQAQASSVISKTQKALKKNQQKLPVVVGKVAFAGPVALEKNLRDTLNQQCQTAKPNQ